MKTYLKHKIRFWRSMLFAFCLMLTAFFIAPGFSSSALAASGSAEHTYWNNVKNLHDPALLRAYIKRYPHGKFVALAQAKLGYGKTFIHGKKVKHKARKTPRVRAAKHHVAHRVHARRKIIVPKQSYWFSNDQSGGGHGGGGGGSSNGGGWQH